MLRKRLAFFISLAAFVVVLVGCSLSAFIRHELQGKEPFGEEEEGPGREARILAYNNLIHRAAPGTDWHAIEAGNAVDAEQYRHTVRKGAGAFAGGLISGSWYERGNNNTAGRMSGFAYDASSNTLYGMSDAGTLWSTTPAAASTSWKLLNDKYKLRSKTLALTPITGGNRLLMARDTDIVYSDNSGSFIQTATGLSYPVAWGGNYVDNIVAVNDGGRSVYALVQGWNSSPWGARVWLYRSADSGKSFSKIYTFSNTDARQVSLFSPYNSGQLYALAMNTGGSDSLFNISGNSVSLLNATTDFPAAANLSVLTGLMNGSQLQLYALIADSLIFKSSNNGASWTYLKTTNSPAWHVLASSTKVVGNIFYGNNEAYASTNGGASFIKVNDWYDYYAAPNVKLHADIQAINFFQNAAGQEFCVIGTDGGAYYSANYMANVNNMSLSSLRVNQLWHHITDPFDPGTIFSGMQDQGLCHTYTATGTGVMTQTQLVSGDYGQMCITRASSALWAEYPGGAISLWGPTNAPNQLAYYNLAGSQKSNAGWLLPTCTIPNLNDEILLGGGNINGGGGSYLAKLSYTSGNINATQYPFNFRTASNSGTSGLSAIAISGLRRSLWYAATEDGTFFRSNNSGTSWTKAAAFTGPTGFWLYGAAIAPSKKDTGTVYFAGSGYSNPGVYVSRDSGATFIAMAAGLPKTLINSLAVTPNDSLIFAATDAGPYVYVMAQGLWYPLIDASTPGSIWKTVEFIPSINTARFSTYGRGMWDFVMGEAVSVGVSGTTITTQSLQVFPNPAVSGGDVSITGLPRRAALLYLMDMSGRMLGRQEWDGIGPVRLPQLPAGNYTYAIRQEERMYQGKLSIR